MFIFRPNIENLDRKRDVRGLLKALHYSGQSEKARRVCYDAAGRLANYPYVKVLEELARVMSGTDDSRTAAHMSIEWLVADMAHQLSKRAAMLKWWESTKDNPDELRNTLKSAIERRRKNEWETVSTRISNEIVPPKHIAVRIHQIIYNDDPTPREDSVVDKWSEEKDRQLAPKLVTARAELEAKWRYQDSLWAKEEASLLNWMP